MTKQQEDHVKRVKNISYVKYQHYPMLSTDLTQPLSKFQCYFLAEIGKTHLKIHMEFQRTLNNLNSLEKEQSWRTEAF